MLSMSGVLYIVAGGAPLVARISGLITAAGGRGWDPCLILTPTAASWLADEVPGLAEQTGHPVRSAYKRPGEADVLPPADAMAVVPATFDMVNKWAAGISDTLALGLINEAIGLDIPLVAVPYVNAPLARHPAWSASLARLAEAGVTVADPGPDPDTDSFGWDQVLDALPRPAPPRRHLTPPRRHLTPPRQDLTPPRP
jgi:hypothetical protein